MPRFRVSCLPELIVGSSLMVGCRQHQPLEPEPTPTQASASAEAAGQEPQAPEYPAGIDPAQTSDDPTYAFTKENPVRLGFPGGAMEGPAASRLYLRHLRDEQFQPLLFQRAGSLGGGADGHIVDQYELRSGDQRYTLFIDMYHPDRNPLDQQAPKGLYFWK